MRVKGSPALIVAAILLVMVLAPVNVAADPVTIFHETFPTADGAWDGSSDTAQNEPGWVTIQDTITPDTDDIQVSDEDVGSSPSGGNHLTFEDCDKGFDFLTPEEYDLAYVSIDLSGYSGVEISYYWQDDDCDATEGMRSAYSTDSTDGKDGTWTLMYEHIAETENVWVKDTHSLPDAACVATFKLRFSADMDATREHIYVDDVMVTGSLPDTTPPEWSDPETEPVTIYEGTEVTFYTNWNDNVALSGYIFSTNQTGLWVNESFTEFSMTPEDAEEVMTITASAGTTVGWRFYANDTSGNWNVTDIQTFVVEEEADTTPPQWSDAKRNKTEVYQNDYVKFTANWTDNVGLSGSVFSINQTGTWVNSSFTVFSGTSNTSENVTQITASVGTTVQWRFYANDTSNNGNATDVQTFVVQSAEVITPVTPFMICGRVFYEDGSECNNSLVVNITNLNNSKQWSANTNSSYNYYQRILANGTDLNASEILQFNVSDGIRYNTTNYAVTQSDINNGGLFNFNLTLPSLPNPVTPFMIYGRVFYEDGSECNGSTVNVTNTNTSRYWQAETNASCNFYQLILDTTNVSEGNLLSFNTSDGIRHSTTNYTVTQENITDGGLFEFNLTLPSPPTPVTPFMIYGWVNYSNGTACNNLTVNITNTNTGMYWQAEAHSSYNYYQLVLDTTNMSAGDLLEFNATDGTEYNITNHTVIAGDIDSGGIFDFNLTLPSAPPTGGPTVDSITITPDDGGAPGVQINPYPGGVKTVTVTVVVSDPNGFGDINSVINITDINPDPAHGDPSPVILSYQSGSGSGNTATYNGTFDMQFYDAPIEYTVTVVAEDTGGLSGNNSSTFNYTSCNAMSLDAGTIAFGSIDPGENNTVTGDVDMGTTGSPTVRNTGNLEIDVNIAGSDMISGGDTITKDRMDAQVDALGYRDLGVARCFDANMTAGASSLESVGFRLNVPYGTPVGSYNGSVTLTADTCGGS